MTASAPLTARSIRQARRRGVIGASSGNHAQALALAGRLLGVPVTVVIPRDAPRVKTDGARALGARVVTYDRCWEERDEITAALAAGPRCSTAPCITPRTPSPGPRSRSAA
jgi:threo-3-hydroxy-L-aspartate ammonia-lyase